MGVDFYKCDFCEECVSDCGGRDFCCKNGAHVCCPYCVDDNDLYFQDKDNNNIEVKYDEKIHESALNDGCIEVYVKYCEICCKSDTKKNMFLNIINKYCSKLSKKNKKNLIEDLESLIC
jgi:hypothetical protein